jgi:hypothetical protein
LSPTPFISGTSIEDRVRAQYFLILEETVL